MSMEKKDLSRTSYTENQILVGELYRNNQSLNKKIVGKMVCYNQCIEVFGPDYEYYYYLVEYTTNHKYLVWDYVDCYRAEYYNDVYVKNLTPIELYLNKINVTDDDIKMLLKGNYNISNNIECNDMILKTINDYSYIFDDNDKAKLLVIIEDYYNAYNNVRANGVNITAMLDLQKTYLNKVYRVIWPKIMNYNDIANEFGSLKKTLTTKK